MADRQDRHEQWVIFWCSLLSPLLYGEIPPEEAGPFLRQLAGIQQEFPDGERRQPSLATLWRKWKQYQQGGFEALFRRRRCDRGKPRKAKPSMVDKAISLKKDQPRRSDETINQFLQEEFHARIPKSTLYRHLKRAGATRLKLGVSKKKVRRRWTRDTTGALWVGDFQDGPYVMQTDCMPQTHLSAFIDCHSRYVVTARYYLRENLDILIDSLLRAWSDHGASRELYVDNAKIYHAKGLQMACLALNIRLLHRAVRDPPGGGLIERFFETAQSQFESEVRAGEILTLDKLNRALAAWLEVSYHQRPNSETKQAPQARYEQGRELVRHVNIQEVLKYFLQRDRRKVNDDFSDVRLKGLFFKVDVGLRGDWVEVRWDPFSQLETVLIYSPHGEYLGVGQRHQREGNAERQPPPLQSGKPKHNYIDLLIQKHDRAMRARTIGIDYQAAMSRVGRRWPFVEFIKQLAAHLGRKGGTSAFRTDELEILEKAHGRLTSLNANMLESACQRAQQRTISEIVFLLQQLHDERRA